MELAPALPLCAVANGQGNTSRPWATSHSHQQHRTGSGRVWFHVEDVEAWSGGGLWMQLRTWGACSNLVVCHQEKGYGPHWAVNQSSAQGQSRWDWGWCFDILRGASSPLPLKARSPCRQLVLSIRSGSYGHHLLTMAIKGVPSFLLRL